MTFSADPTRSPADGVAASGALEFVSATVDRIWQLRREAEIQPRWHIVVMGVLTALGFTLIAGAQFLPGGATVALPAIGALVILMVIVGWLGIRRGSLRGHSGTVTTLPGVERPWWRSSAMAGPAAYTVVLIGGITGVFDHWPFVLGCGILLGLAFAKWYPRYETADHLTGPHLENSPALTADAVNAVAAGELTPDILEVLVLQHHTGERRVTWCAKVLGTTPEDIRDRTRRGRRWLELPATEAHHPLRATWIRLSAEGREALGYL